MRMSALLTNEDFSNLRLYTERAFRNLVPAQDVDDLTQTLCVAVAKWDCMATDRVSALGLLKAMHKKFVRNVLANYIRSRSCVAGVFVPQADDGQELENVECARELRPEDQLGSMAFAMFLESLPVVHATILRTLALTGDKTTTAEEVKCSRQYVHKVVQRYSTELLDLLAA